MINRRFAKSRWAAASMGMLGLVSIADVAVAQQTPDGYGEASSAPPPAGQYQQAPGPQGAQPYNQDYANQYADWQRRYADWSARYCVNQRNNNAAAGAVVGGVMGAVLGAGVAGW